MRRVGGVVVFVLEASAQTGVDAGVGDEAFFPAQPEHAAVREGALLLFDGNGWVKPGAIIAKRTPRIQMRVEMDDCDGRAVHLCERP